MRSQGSESSEEVKVRCRLVLLLFRFNFNFFATNIQMDCYYPTHPLIPSLPYHTIIKIDNSCSDHTLPTTLSYKKP